MDRFDGQADLAIPARDRIHDRPRPAQEPCPVTDHRAHVVERLLERQVAPTTLATLLPEWSSLIEDADHHHDDVDAARRA
jgi:hypothetical protein